MKAQANLLVSSRAKFALIFKEYLLASTICTKISLIDSVFFMTDAFEKENGHYETIMVVLTLCMLGNFSCFCCPLLLTFFKTVSGTRSECQTIWVHLSQLFAKVINRVNRQQICCGKESFSP